MLQARFIGSPYIALVIGQFFWNHPVSLLLQMRFLSLAMSQLNLCYLSQFFGSPCIVDVVGQFFVFTLCHCCYRRGFCLLESQRLHSICAISFLYSPCIFVVAGEVSVSQNVSAATLNLCYQFFVFTVYLCCCRRGFCLLECLSGIAQSVLLVFCIHRVSLLLQVRFLSPRMSQRLRSVCAIPLTALSQFAIFTFFANTDIGYLIFHRLIVTSMTNKLFCHLSLFCVL